MGVGGKVSILNKQQMLNLDNLNRLNKMKCQRYYNLRFYNHNKIATTSTIKLNVWDREDYKNNQQLILDTKNQIILKKQGFL